LKLSEIGTRFGPANLAMAMLEDDTGSVRLNLWRDQIEVAKAGDIIVLENAFAREFGGVVEVNIEADGKLAVFNSERLVTVFCHTNALLFTPLNESPFRLI